MKLDTNEMYLGSTLHDKYRLTKKSFNGQNFTPNSNINYLIRKNTEINCRNSVNEKFSENDRTKSRLVKDRRSFYDNQEFNVNNNNLSESDNDSDSSINAYDAQCQTDFSLYKNTEIFRTEKNIHLAEINFINKKIDEKLERDDFDDLIDLTHRIPRKVFKSETFKRVNNNSNGSKLSSSKTTLPPLPFSFVKIENNNSRNITYQNLKANSTNNSPHVPKGTTRLIIPIKTYEKNGHEQKSYKTLGEVLRENSTNIKTSSQPSSPYSKSKQSNFNSQPASPQFKKPQPTARTTPPRPSFKENLKTRPDESTKSNTRSKSTDVNKDWDQVNNLTFCFL